MTYAIMNPVRTLALIAGLGAAVFSLPAFAQKKSLIVAEPVHGIGYLPLYVAMRNGYFAEENLDVKKTTTEGGAAHINAVLTGQAFAFIGGPEHNARAKIQGANLRAVVNIVDRGNVYLVAKKGVAMKPGQSVADFVKGKTIATGFFGGTPNSITRYLLGQWKLDARRDVVLQEMTNGAVLAAVRAGKAQIGVTSDPILVRGVIQNIWDEPFYNVPKELGPYAYSTLNITLESIKQDPKTVAAFVRGVMRGLRFTHEEPEKAAAIAKLEFPTMEQSDLKATLDRAFADNQWSRDGLISEAAWVTARSVVMGAGSLREAVPYDDVIDMQFVRAVLASTK